jgi:hypothetical protein
MVLMKQKIPTAQKSLQKINEIVAESVEQYGESKDEAWLWVYEAVIVEWIQKLNRQTDIEAILERREQ